jgi:hypothetical protein
MNYNKETVKANIKIQLVKQNKIRKTKEKNSKLIKDFITSFINLNNREPEFVFSKINITKEQQDALLANINKKMAAAPIKLRTTFNL